MNWLVFAGLSVLLYSVAALFQRLAMKKDDADPVISSVIFQFIIAVGISCITFFYGFNFPPANMWLPIFIAGTLYGSGTVFLFRGIKIIEASEMIIVTTFGTIVALTVSYFFLHERLTPIQLLGTLLILSATVLVKLERTSLRFNKGIIYALAGASCYGVAVVIDGYILTSVNMFSYLPLSNLISGLAILAMYPGKILSTIRYVKNLQSNLVIYSLLYAGAAIMFYIPIQSGVLVSQMSAANRISILLTVILSMIFLRERDNMAKKILSALLTTIGIMLIK